MKKNNIIMSLIIIIIIISVVTFIVVKNNKKVEVKMPKYSISKINHENCKLSYEKLCFNIPDDYKCVGNNKCQLSNDSDMLLVQVYLDENYKKDINTFIKSGINNFSSNLEKIEEKEINGNIWTTGKVRTQDIRYYFIKVDKNVYSVKVLSKRDSGGKFDELIRNIEESLKVSK